MAHEPSAPMFDYSVLQSLTTPQEQLIVLLLDAVQKLADAGEVDAACRIAGSACGCSAAKRCEERTPVQRIAPSPDTQARTGEAGECRE